MSRFLSDDERRLYELIWKRAVASQMVPATLNTVAVDLAAGSEHSFRASGTTVVDPGFLAVYEEGKDTKTSEDEDEGRKLPAMKIGDRVPLDRIHTDQHFTEPPPRFSEAALVKALEEYGIGRPSTYASIIQTLQFRKYVETGEPPLPSDRRRPRGQRSSCPATSPATSTTTSPPSSRTNSTRCRAARRSGCR